MTDSIEQREREQFEEFVKRELGDVPVMDNGRYVSMKINNYWRTWQEARRAALSAPQAGVPEPAKRALEVLGMFQHHCPNVTGHRGGVFVCQRAGGAVSQNSYCAKCECPEAAPPAPGAPAQVPAPGDSGAAVAVPPAELSGKARQAVATAYGHLWHVNNESAAPIPVRRPETAAYEARKVLRDLLTNEERGQAINEVGRLLGRYVLEIDTSGVYPEWTTGPSRFKDWCSRHFGPDADEACRTDGRCQYAIDHGAEGLGHCPKGKCAMPAEPVGSAAPAETAPQPDPAASKSHDVARDAGGGVVEALNAEWLARIREKAAEVRNNSLALEKFDFVANEARFRALAALYLEEVAQHFERMKKLDETRAALRSLGGEQP